MTDDPQHMTAKWAERDARRLRHEADMALQRERARLEHAHIIAKALDSRWPEHDWSLVALVAVDALMADGVIFAYMSPPGLFPDEAES